MTKNPTPITVAETTGAVMVVGGGISGMQSALDLANSGFKVYLVERSPGIGGKMAQLDKTFPTNDCSMCIVSPKLVEVGRHRNIELLTHSEVTGLDGEAGNFSARITQHARYVDVDKCTGCGLCELVCPVTQISWWPEQPEEGEKKKKLKAKDKKIIRYLQRLLYSGDSLLRQRAAEILGGACAVLGDRDSGMVSKLLQSLFYSLTDTAAYPLGAFEAIGEIIAQKIPKFYLKIITIGIFIVIGILVLLSSFS